MAQTSEIEQLTEHRRALVARSGRLRQELVGELARLLPAAAWVERGYSLAQALRSVWPALALVAGVLVTRRKSGWLKSVGKLWSWWRLARNLKALWPRRAADAPASDGQG